MANLHDVKVIVHTPDSDDVFGAIHARNGQPVEVRLTRDTNTTVVRLSVREALDLVSSINIALAKV